MLRIKSDSVYCVNEKFQLFRFEIDVVCGATPNGSKTHGERSKRNSYNPATEEEEEEKLLGKCEK